MKDPLNFPPPLEGRGEEDTEEKYKQICTSCGGAVNVIERATSKPHKFVDYRVRNCSQCGDSEQETWFEGEYIGRTRITFDGKNFNQNLDSTPYLRHLKKNR